jgi:exopolysaccharide biosynthesis protein
MANGNLVCIVSNEGGLVSVNEISQIAKHYGVVNATLFDGGSALQYSFNDGDYSCSFSAIANSGFVPGFIKRLIRKKSNSNVPARSPVYLYVR